MRKLAILLLSFAGAGCAPLVPDEALAGDAVMGHLQLRDRTITLVAGEGGTRFTVRAADGTVLAEQLTLEELGARHPDLLELVRTSVAARSAGRVLLAD
jgi:hypothetical protein